MYPKIKLAVGVGALLFVGSNADNFDPIVLVHGLASSPATWEYRAELEQSGLPTIALQVNPFASNHDRAVELYAQLKGTVVDYGKCHSDSFDGHLQFSGVSYENQGLIPDWGPNRKIHLVGHSMGGQTIRTLERLLRDGSGCAGDTSELFTGGNDWITSVTTFSTPFDGTTLIDVARGNEAALFETLLQFGVFDDGSLDFPQYGLVQGETESFNDYVDRLIASGVIASEDFSLFDLKIEGADKFNAAGPDTYSNTYYFAYALERTDPEQSCFLGIFNCRTIQVASSDMSFALRPPANIMGRNDNAADRENDGAVNQVRARCPNGSSGQNSNCPVRNLDSSFTWTQGEWNVALISYLDHFQITGRDTLNDLFNFDQSAQRIYLELGSRLQSLDSTSTLPSEADIFKTRNAAGKLNLKLKGQSNIRNMKVEDEDNSAPGKAFAFFFAIFLGVGLLAFGSYKAVQKFKRNDELVETRVLKVDTL